MENDPNSRFPEPEPRPADDAIIRDIMDKKGISFAEARQAWEMIKAATNQQVNEQRQQEENESNG